MNSKFLERRTKYRSILQGHNTFLEVRTLLKTCFWISIWILTSYNPISSKHIGEGKYLIAFDPNKSNLLRNSRSSFINREKNINSLDHYFSHVCVFLWYLSFWFVLGKLFFIWFLILKLWFCIFLMQVYVYHYRNEWPWSC